MGNKFNFLLAAVQDNQATVRAVDVKTGALLVATLSPVPLLGRIFKHFEGINLSLTCVGAELLCVVFIVFWILAVISLVRGLSAIDNPAEHIVNSDKATGIFYSGGLFKLRLWDVFTNSPVIKAGKDIMTFMDNIPKSEEDCIKELSFELMKVAYIRDIKMLRLKWAYIFISIWFCTGLCIYLLSRYYSA